MKKIILFTSIIALSYNTYSQSTDTTKVVAADTTQKSDAKLTFETDLHDFGDIEYGGNGTYDFKFKNTGTTPLIISNAKGSCGCTVPTYPKGVPIKPGESNTIKVTYDTKRVGHFMKTVRVTSNASNDAKVITIRGKVLEEVKEEVFPVNGKPATGSIPFESK